MGIEWLVWTSKEWSSIGATFGVKPPALPVWSEEKACGTRPSAGVEAHLIEKGQNQQDFGAALATPSE
jgi:hypothetical protein